MRTAVGNVVRQGRAHHVPDLFELRLPVDAQKLVDDLPSDVVRGAPAGFQSRRYVPLQHDLIVRWTDGELTLYKDVDQNGFHGEIQVKKPNRLWTHATILGAGDYTDNRHPDDFLVRWSDGEVSMYPDADETGLNREITLVYPPA